MHKDNRLPDSFVGRSDRFYVLRNEGSTITRKYAVYSRVIAYDTRSETPIYIDADEALTDFSYELKIYPESLTTTPPVYPADRDATDYGLTPERNVWRNRLQKAREGRIHVA